MQIKSCAILSLVAASYVALASKTKTPPNLVADGSFEAIQGRDFQTDFTAGNWTFTGPATIDANYEGECDGCGTPYGNNYVVFFREFGRDMAAAFSQNITGLTAGSYNVSYSYKIATSSIINCTLKCTLASKTIDTFVFPAMAPSYDAFKNRSATFKYKPKESTAALAFELSCPRTKGERNYWDYDLDQISLVAIPSAT